MTYATPSAIIQIIQQIEDNNPINELSNNEIDLFIVKFGSLLSIHYNKIINPAFLFLTLLGDRDIYKIYNTFIQDKTLIESYKRILKKYPMLVKSKMIKDEAIKITKKKSNHANKQIRRKSI